MAPETRQWFLKKEMPAANPISTILLCTSYFAVVTCSVFCTMSFYMFAGAAPGGNCPPPMIIPLPHSKTLLEIFLKSEKKCVGVPPPPPPPPLSDFFRAGAKLLCSRSSSETFFKFCPPPPSKHPGTAPACLYCCLFSSSVEINFKLQFHYVLEQLGALYLIA